MDSVRSKFLWRGDETKFKYHMVRWENVCFPKDYSGLGVINTRRMNEALLTKWIWRILENRENDPCVQLLRRKYLASKPFATSTARGVPILEGNSKNQTPLQLGLGFCGEKW